MASNTWSGAAPASAGARTAPAPLLALQLKLQGSGRSGAAPSALGPTPDLINHLYRNPAGIRITGTLVTKGLVVRLTLAAMLPLLLLLLNSLLSSREGGERR